MAALTRIPGRAARPLLLALALAIAAAGCTNPFAPATPESPDAGGIVEDFSTPAKLLGTLEAAMGNKGPSGRLAWRDAMADSTGAGTRAFYAFQDPRVLSAWRLSSPVTPPDPWTIDNETRFYDKFIGQFDGEYVLVFDKDDTSPKDDIDESAGTALLHRKYYVGATASSTTLIVAIGYVDLYLVKYQGRWFVVRWDDRLDPLIGVDPADPNNRTLGWRRLESAAS